MKILRHSGFALPACVLMVASTPYAEENSARSTLELRVREDLARWNALPLAQLEYQQPPQGWHRVDSDFLRVGFSMPCEPALKKMAKQGQTVVMYICAIDGRQYSLLAYLSTDMRVSEFRNGLFCSLPNGMLKRAAELGLPSSFQPKNRVSFQGAIGREAILNLAANQIELRMLPSSDAMISMQVSDLPKNQPGDSVRYFNSLKFL